MRRNYPGLTQERLPSGNWRLRVRVKGQPSRRIVLHVPFEHPEFHAAYAAARQGREYDPQTPAAPALLSVRNVMAVATRAVRAAPPWSPMNDKRICISRNAAHERQGG